MIVASMDCKLDGGDIRRSAERVCNIVGEQVQVDDFVVKGSRFLPTSSVVVSGGTMYQNSIDLRSALYRGVLYRGVSGLVTVSSKCKAMHNIEQLSFLRRVSLLGRCKFSAFERH